jgi:hypothetical protein
MVVGIVAWVAEDSVELEALMVVELPILAAAAVSSSGLLRSGSDGVDSDGEAERKMELEQPQQILVSWFPQRPKNRPNPQPQHWH